MNKKIYLCNMEWTQTQEKSGGVSGEFILKENVSYEDYEKLLTKDLSICDYDLQQENKQLKETMDKKDFLLKSQGDELRELYEENERLKNLCDSYEEEHCEIFTTWCNEMKQMKVNNACFSESMDAIEEMIEKLKNISAAYNK